MNRKHLFAFSLLVLVSSLTGCFQFQPGLFLHREGLDEEFQVGRHTPKIDNFFIILDASTSMSVSYKNEMDDSKFRVAKDFLRRMNNTMPEMNVNGSLLTFGRGIEQLAKQTEIVYGPTAYTRSGLDQSLSSLSFSAEGNSPAGRAIDSISNAIGSAKGDNAVIFISDGENLEGRPRVRARALKDRYGERVCFYTVWIGNKPEGKIFLEELASEVECGLSVSVDDTRAREGMVDFVKQVFLTTVVDSDRDGVPDSLDKCPETPFGVEVDRFGCPKIARKDSDGDGVYDGRDRCPDTPVGVVVDEFGCPKIARKDSDGDGVYDELDKCPDTPIDVVVDDFGCPTISQIDSDGDGVYDNVDECKDTPVDAIVDNRGCWVVKGVQFDYKKWGVKPQFNSNLNNIEIILRKNSGLKIRIEGHTDDIGPMNYNMGLSSKRAQAIKDYLVNKGIDPSRITTTGLGYTQPIADNDTPEGRALNRRAEIIPVK